MQGWSLCDTLDTKPLGTLTAMMSKGINSPRSNSCGRLFDAVAAAIGLCQDAVSYEGQAAIALESIADAPAYGVGAWLSDSSFANRIRHLSGHDMMDFSPLWLAILDDLENQTQAGVMASTIPSRTGARNHRDGPSHF